MAEAKKMYLLKGGTHAYHRNENDAEETIAQKGDLVPLTASQYESFKDKFSDPEEEKANAEKVLASIKAQNDEATKKAAQDAKDAAQAASDAAKADSEAEANANSDQSKADAGASTDTSGDNAKKGK